MTGKVTVANSGWEMDTRPVDVVVISSQVAYGAVGNTATARVLTEARHRCVQVPTVLLGTLPHYPTLHGGPIPDEWLGGILDDLLTLEALSTVKYVLVGYLAHAGQAHIIADWFTRLRASVDDVRLVVDPAMGDDDVGMYTDPDVASAYGTYLVPAATGLTPNRFELSLLAGTDAVTSNEIRSRASEIRPDSGWVVVTSTTPSHNDDRVGNIVVDHRGATEIDHKRIVTHAKGAGDIFTGTIIARLLAGDTIGESVAVAGDFVADTIRASRPG